MAIRSLFSGLYLLQLFSTFNQAAFSAKAFHIRDSVPSNATFPWVDLKPSKDLQWVKCYSGLQCARLAVPLDYSNPDGREAAIALIRKPAEVSADSEQYRGPVLINPGGPGGSGVDTIVEPLSLTALQLALGPQFDIVGFDPRGVGRSTPTISFFKTPVERALFMASYPTTTNSSDGTLSRMFASTQLLSKLATTNDDGYLKNMNTDYTARDMLRIVEAYGRQKLVYWGISYGTALGATFAAMFPDKVERILLDGVVDVEKYYANDWSGLLDNNEKVLDTFYIGCSEAGPQRCPFYAPSPDAIRQNVATIMSNLKQKPIPVQTDQSYGVVDDTWLKTQMFLSLYSPYLTFNFLASSLAGLAQGNASLIFTLGQTPPFQCNCSPENGDNKAVVDAKFALSCNDGNPIPNTLEHAQSLYNNYNSLSQFGPILMAGVVGTCFGWPQFDRSHLFRGPFNANTSHPLMLVGNTLDPVTPVSRAHIVSKGFNGSSVLTLDAAGHSSLFVPSTCTRQYIQAYFVNGTLPAQGTVCKPDHEPFDPAA